MKTVGWVAAILLAVNVWFNWGFWQQLFTSGPDTNLATSDGRITEWIVETGYQRIIRGANPWAASTKLFYPFTTDLALNDSGMLLLLPYSLLRPWTGIHQAMVGAVILSLLASSFAMYALMRVLGHSRMVAGLIALIYTYMPFTAGKVQGHYTYLCLYLFPLLYLSIYRLMKVKTTRGKWGYALMTGVIAGLVWLGNVYYGVSTVIALLIYALGLAIYYPKQVWPWIKQRWVYVVASGAAMSLVLMPWALAVREEIRFAGFPRNNGYGGALQLSLDVSKLLSPKVWGVVLLLGLGYGWLKRRELSRVAQVQLRLPLIAAACFAVLTLGPFLKIMGRWHVSLEGIAVLFPLPYLLIQSLPGLAGLRAPERLVPVVVFFGCVALATIITALTKKLAERQLVLVWIGLGGLFVLSQFYLLPYKQGSPIPSGLYQSVSKEEGGTVLEIPLTVRDGYRYLGDMYALTPMYGQLVHARPIIGGYLARVREPVFDYYSRLDLLGYLLQITDRGNYSRLIESPRDPRVTAYGGTREAAVRELDFLQVTDVLVRQNEAYTEQVESTMTALGLRRKAVAEGYAWWQREVGQQDFSRAIFGQLGDQLFVGGGLIRHEGRPAEVNANRSEILLFPIRGVNYTQVYAKVASSGPVAARLYIDRKLVGSVTFAAGEQEISLPWPARDQAGLARLTWRWEIPVGTTPMIYVSEVGIR